MEPKETDLQIDEVEKEIIKQGQALFIAQGEDENIGRQILENDKKNIELQLARKEIKTAIRTARHNLKELEIKKSGLTRLYWKNK